MRVDKWIWAVRMVKSRTLAGLRCKQGKVLVNGLKVKPSSNVKIGDVITVDNGSVEKQYQVTGFIPKRVSAELAAQNYEDLTPAVEATEKQPRIRFWGQRLKGEGRPTKKDWRDIRETKDYFES